MTWIILTVILGLIGLGAIFWALFGPATDKGVASIAALAVAVLWLAITGFMSFAHSIGAGHVGLVYQFSALTGQTGSGQVSIWPWESLKDANTQTLATQFKLDSFSKETQNVFITATLNYRVAPADVQTLYRTVGSGWFNTLIPQRVNQAFKDETVLFRAVEIAPHRNQIRADVLVQLKKDLAPFSIQATALNIDNISFSPAFTNAIEDKQIATQEAQAAQNRVSVAKYQAQQIIATAKGQAAANTLKRQTLTPLLVQQNMIDKLNPNVQVILLPSNGNLLLPSSLFSTTTGSSGP